MKFWIPWTGDIGLLDYIKNHPLKTNVVGFFGSSPVFSSSAREKSVLKTQDGAVFCEAIMEIHRAGFEFGYTFNSVVDLGIEETMDILGTIEALRPDRVVFASPHNLILAADMKPKPEFEVSTIAEIINPSQCEWWAAMGATKFTLSTRLSRFPEVIEQNFANYDVKILVNEICLLNCPWRQTHYIRQSMDIPSEVYPYNFCQREILKDFPEQILKNSWVLPSQTKNYSDNVEGKIIGRTNPLWRVKQWANYYLNEEDPEDIMDILPYGKAPDDKTVHAGFNPVEGKQPELLKLKIPEAFWNRFERSTKPCYAEDCEKCGLCKKIAKGYNKE